MLRGPFRACLRTVLVGEEVGSRELTTCNLEVSLDHPVVVGDEVFDFQPSVNDHFEDGSLDSSLADNIVTEQGEEPGQVHAYEPICLASGKSRFCKMIEVRTGPDVCDGLF